MFAHNRWLVLIAMTGSLAMVLVDQTVVAVALPTIGSDLHLSPIGQQWIVNAYLLAMAAFVAIGGRLGDKFGGVVLFRAGIVIFFLASIGCGFAPTNAWGEAWMITFRALQGIGAALMMPVSAAIVLSVFDKSSAGRAMAVYTGIGQIFLALGPLIGGFLTEFVTWRAVFWLNIPLGIASLVLVAVSKPPNHPDRTIPISIRNAILLVVGIATTILALQQGASWGWTSGATLAAAAVGIASCTLFAMRSLHFKPPLIDLRLLADKELSTDLFIAFVLRFAILGVALYFSMYLQDVLGMGATRAGLALLPMAAAQLVGSQVGGWAYDKKGLRPPVLIGLGLCIVGMGYWAFALTLLDYSLIVPALVVCGFAFGLTVPAPGTDALAHEADVNRNQASGLLLTVRQIGGTLGVAMMGAVILSADPLATRSPDHQASADATSIGFAAAACVFLVAWIAAWWLLPNTKAAGTGRTGRPQ
ncbi:MFS transporter [Acuticoccus sp. M5D2P5]|uniref:MFS transporter n=1 Tax=Acuticoccus kalidii TaxID=2910977 RepID=UPI001F3802A2|nr:MFS transporter [Acuticoccus kalidii]MCF3934813.1 MFS transporter [Acuticoccus kalidii]